MSRTARRPAPPRPAATAPEPAPAAWAAPAAYGVIALFALALVALAAGPHRVGDVFAETDFYGGYGPGARALQHGHVDAGRYGVVGPVFEFVLALVGFVVRDLFTAAEAISIVSMTAVLLAWFRIVRARAGGLAGLVTVALLAANAHLLRYGYAASTDALALALQAWALALLLAGPAPPRRALAAGAIAGLAFLTRYNAGVLLPAGAVALLAGWTDTAPGERRAAAWRFAAGFAGPAAVWIAFSLLSGARFHFMLHHNIAYEVFARARGIPWDTYERSMESQFPTPWSVLARDPGAVTRQVFANVFGHLRLDAQKLAGWPLAAGAAAGLVLGALDRRLGRLGGAWLAAALLFLALVPTFHQERWSLVALPAWAALAALACTSPRLAAPLPAAGRAALAPVLALLVLVPSLQRSVAVQRRALDQLPSEVRQVARDAQPWLRPGDRVYARKPHFAWHAGLVPMAFPFADSLSQLAAAARRDGVRWLYFSWPEAETRPALEFLLDTTSAVPGLAVRAASAHHPAVLYEILPGFGREPDWFADRGRLAEHRARARSIVNLVDWRSRLVVATALELRGDFAGAQPWLDAALRIAPANADVLAENGNNLLRLERPGDARAMFLRLEQADPSNPAGPVGRGWAALLEHRADEAARLWRPEVARTQDEPTLRRMAEVYTALGDPAAAAEARARLVALGYAP